jgi:hypothetical protein
MGIEAGGRKSDEAFVPFSLKYYAERVPEIVFADVKDYQKLR